MQFDYRSHEETPSRVRAKLRLPSAIMDTMLSHPQSLSRREHLYCCGDSDDRLYVILSGSLKTYRVTADGEEQIVGFQFPINLFGTDGFLSRKRNTCVAALEETRVCSISAYVLQRLLSENDVLRGQWIAMLSRRIRKEHRFTEMLRQNNSEQRVACFLLHLRDLQCPYANRLDESRFCLIHLPMSRRDIANYLGIAVETVSRAFSHFQESKLLRGTARHVEITHSARLRAMVNAYTNPYLQEPGYPG